MSDTAPALTLSGPVPLGIAGFEPGEQAAALLREGISGKEYIEVLEAAKLYPDAIGFLACMLPKRQAVWWALQCAKRSYSEGVPAEKAAALNAAEKWIAQPNEESR